MEEIEGRVEAISIKNKGIKVLGRWFNVSESLSQKLRQINKGDIVKLEIDDFGNVLNLEILSKSYQNLSKEEKIKMLGYAIEIYKIYMSYHVPEIKFESGQGIKIEEVLERLKKIYEEISKWIL